jgi:hypothetical protein
MVYRRRYGREALVVIHSVDDCPRVELAFPSFGNRLFERNFCLYGVQSLSDVQSLQPWLGNTLYGALLALAIRFCLHAIDQ